MFVELRDPLRAGELALLVTPVPPDLEGLVLQGEHVVFSGVDLDDIRESRLFCGLLKIADQELPLVRREFPVDENPSLLVQNCVELVPPFDLEHFFEFEVEPLKLLLLGLLVEESAPLEYPPVLREGEAARLEGTDSLEPRAGAPSDHGRRVDYRVVIGELAVNLAAHVLAPAQDLAPSVAFFEPLALVVRIPDIHAGAPGNEGDGVVVSAGDLEDLAVPQLRNHADLVFFQQFLVDFAESET